jgi:hypothetical protein
VVKAGKIVLHVADAGAAGWDVTGVGFEPTAVVFIFADSTVEDSWDADSTNLMNGGMGVASWVNSEDHSQLGPAGTGINNSAASMTLGLSAPMDSSFSTLSSVLVRDTHGSFGYTTSVRSFNADGWNMRFGNAGTLHTGAEGKIVYYLAIGGRKTAADFALTTPGVINATTTVKTLAWEPKGVVEVGGTNTQYVGDAFDAYSAVSFPGVPFPGAQWGMSLGRGSGLRFIPVGGGDSSYWYLDGRPGIYAPGVQFKSVKYDFDSSGFVDVANEWETTYVTTPTSLETTMEGVNLSGLSWSSTFNKWGQLIIGAADMENGTFVPNAVVDDPPVQVTTDIVPEAFIFFSGGPGDFINNPTHQDDVYYGHTTIGFLTDSFQCVVCYGGNAIGNNARFCSSVRSWVSNIVDPVPIGSFPTLGETDLTAQGFTHTTKQNDSNDVRQVLWFGIGDLMPSFVPQIYRRGNRRQPTT